MVVLTVRVYSRGVYGAERSIDTLALTAVLVAASAAIDGRVLTLLAVDADGAWPQAAEELGPVLLASWGSSDGVHGPGPVSRPGPARTRPGPVSRPGPARRGPDPEAAVATLEARTTAGPLGFCWREDSMGTTA